MTAETRDPGPETRKGLAGSRVSDLGFRTFMHINHLHNWNLTPKQAIALQQRLRSKVVCRRAFRRIETIAGADLAFEGKRAIAGVIVYQFSEPLSFGTREPRPGTRSLIEIERTHATVPLTFPYVPGLLSFREGPALLKVFRQLGTSPDVILFDGQGIAHPRGLGLASHMGLWLGIPTIGCAKSRLIGEYDEPGPEVGDWAPLVVETRDPGPETRKIVGAVLRTRRQVKPIYVSIGHMIDLKSAIEVTLACLDRTRIPRPTREADHLVNKKSRGPTYGFVD